jgi:hypothetical protein
MKRGGRLDENAGPVEIGLQNQRVGQVPTVPAADFEEEPLSFPAEDFLNHKLILATLTDPMNLGTVAFEKIDNGARRDVHEFSIFKRYRANRGISGRRRRRQRFCRQLRAQVRVRSTRYYFRTWTRFHAVNQACVETRIVTMLRQGVNQELLINPDK